jgi:hypothetical protein
MSEICLDWYERCIEQEIRELVKYLRNNGINTECSCGHEMYIQCQYIKGDSIYDIHALLYNYFYEHNKCVPYYRIEVFFEHLVGGFQCSSLTIYLKEKTP